MTEKVENKVSISLLAAPFSFCSIILGLFETTARLRINSYQINLNTSKK